jgi:hypothetical protein
MRRYPLLFLPLLILLLGGCASAAKPEPAQLQAMPEPVESPLEPLPVAITLLIDEEIATLHREIRATSLLGKTYTFDVSLGPLVSDGIEAAMRSVYRDVFTVRGEGLPEIRFELGRFHSKVSVTDKPLSVHVEADTQLALDVFIVDAAEQPIFETTVSGGSRHARETVLGGVGQAGPLVTQTARAALEEALGELATVLRHQGDLPYYGDGPR